VLAEENKSPAVEIFGAGYLFPGPETQLMTQVLFSLRPSFGCLRLSLGILFFFGCATSPGFNRSPSQRNPVMGTHTLIINESPEPSRHSPSPLQRATGKLPPGLQPSTLAPSNSLGWESGRSRSIASPQPPQPPAYPEEGVIGRAAPHKNGRRNGRVWRPVPDHDPTGSCGKNRVSKVHARQVRLLSSVLNAGRRVCGQVRAWSAARPNHVPSFSLSN